MSKAVKKRIEIEESPTVYVAENPESFTVQQVVELTGLSEHTLRYYEKANLIEAVKRDSSSGHRRYSAENLAKIKSLACLRATGMPLEQMRKYFDLAKFGIDSADELQNLLRNQRIVLQEKMSQMQKNMDYLEYKISYWQEIKEKAQDGDSLESLQETIKCSPID